MLRCHRYAATLFRDAAYAAPPLIFAAYCAEIF